MLPTDGFGAVGRPGDRRREMHNDPTTEAMQGATPPLGSRVRWRTSAMTVPTPVRPFWTSYFSPTHRQAGERRPSSR
jgi:hypothetical protein